MIQHIAMVFQAEGLNHSEKALLFAYCNHTNGHGYCTAGIPRLSDESGMSVRTVNRTNTALKAKGLIKSARRVDPRTGEQITNLTRVNLKLLASMKRAEPEYDDNLIDALTFPEDADESAQVDPDAKLAQGSDLHKCQSDTPPPTDWQGQGRQSDAPPSDNLAPNPYPSSVRTSPDPEKAEEAHTEDTPGPVLTEPSPEVLRQAAEIASRLDLTRLDAKPKQTVQITRALAQALTRPDADTATVERYAAATIAGCRTVKYLLGAFEPARLTIGLPAYRAGDIPAAAPAEPCPIHPWVARRVTDGECLGCRADRIAAPQPAAEIVPDMAAEIARTRARMATLRSD